MVLACISKREPKIHIPRRGGPVFRLPALVTLMVCVSVFVCAGVCCINLELKVCFLRLKDKTYHFYNSSRWKMHRAAAAAATVQLVRPLM